MPTTLLLAPPDFQTFLQPCVRVNASFHEIVVSTYVVYMFLNVYTVYMVDYIHKLLQVLLSWLKNYPLPVVNKSLCKVLRSLSDPDG